MKDIYLKDFELVLMQRIYKQEQNKDQLLATLQGNYKARGRG